MFSVATVVKCTVSFVLIFGISPIIECGENIPAQASAQGILNVWVLDSTQIAFGINNSGKVVGDTTNGSGYLYTDGVLTEVNGTPYSINSAGRIAGRNGNSGFLMDESGQYTFIDVPNSTYTQIYPQGINDSGLVVGIFNDVSGNTFGFIYDAGRFKTLVVPGTTGNVPTSVNDSGEVVGITNNNVDGTEDGFLYSRGTFTILKYPGGQFTEPSGINNAGRVVGGYETGFGTDQAKIHGFSYYKGVFKTIDVPGAADTVPTAINNFGDISGQWSDGTGRNGIFLYSEGELFLSPTYYGILPISMNDAGQIVGGVSFQNFDDHGFVATAPHFRHERYKRADDHETEE